MAVRAETERVRRYYEQTAHRYDEYVGYFEKLLVGDGRQWVCGQARGEVLEIAIGTGRNLPYYPSDVQLTGIDFTPAMLDIARQRASALGREVDLRVGDAQSLEFPDGRFDTVVATLALCTIPDERRTVAEMRRMLQRLLDPLFVRFYGDHLLREPLDHLAAEGFVIEDVERSKGGLIERLVTQKPGAALST